MEQPKDEFSYTPVRCPRCGKTATSVYRTGKRIFYNHGDGQFEYADGQVRVTWKSCDVDRPNPAPGAQFQGR